MYNVFQLMKMKTKIGKSCYKINSLMKTKIETINCFKTKTKTKTVFKSKKQVKLKQKLVLEN